MTLSSWALQVGLYTHISADPELVSWIGAPPRIFDQPPPDAVFPLITLGEGRSRAILGAPGAMEHDIRIRIYSRYAGRAQTKEIADIVMARLQDADITLEGCRLVSIRLLFCDTLRGGEPDGYETVMRFRAVTEAEEA